MLIQKYSLWRKMMEHLVNTGEQLMWFVVFTLRITCTLYNITRAISKLTLFQCWERFCFYCFIELQIAFQLCYKKKYHRLNNWEFRKSHSCKLKSRLKHSCLRGRNCFYKAIFQVLKISDTVHFHPFS